MPKSQNSSQPFDQRLTLALIFVAIALTICGVWLISQNTPRVQQERAVSTAQKKLEESTVKVIKADLDLYYALNSHYPVSMDSFIQDVVDYPDRYSGTVEVDEFKSSLKTLKDFTYSPRGDFEAYKFTYTNLENEITNVTGNYKEDYH